MMRLFMSGALTALVAATGTAGAEPARYSTPEDSVAALISALETKNEAAVIAVFGPENADIVSSGNAEEDRQIWGDFLHDTQRVLRIEREGDDRAILFAGRDFWPFPAPLMLSEGSWSFDAEAAREEVLMRRIGRHELEVIEILRRVPDIQRRYREADHDGDGVMEFAASILSSPEARDGLYWPETPGTAPSPFNDSIARANFSGYNLDGEDRDPEPYEGYYFRILQGQGDNAPGGAYSYMVAGNMVASHALVAYPAVYGDTGVMSFLVGEAGIVYEADLGDDTLALATEILLFDPTEEWTPVE